VKDKKKEKEKYFHGKFELKNLEHESSTAGNDETK
jgi:hypothetical protein